MRAHFPVGDGFGRGLGQKVDVAVFQISQFEADLETLGGEGDSMHVLKAGRRVSFGH